MMFTNPPDERVPTALPHTAHRTAPRSLTDVLPADWHALVVPGMDHPIVVGPGGLFVLHLRHHAMIPLGVAVPGDSGSWAPDHQHRMSTPQLDAALVSQLVNWACATDLTCTPVIVIEGEHAGVVARPDGVEVIHDHVFMRWLGHLPPDLDRDTLGIVVEHLSATRSSSAV